MFYVKECYIQNDLNYLCIKNLRLKLKYQTKSYNFYQ